MKLIISIMITVYLTGYVLIRTLNAEVWDQDNHTYVIFPKSPIILYYLYRPITYLDASLTGMRFHIGPHQTN